MVDTLTPSFPMEKKFDYNCETMEDVIRLNSLSFEIQEIFTRELSMTEYYDKKNLRSKWQSRTWQVHSTH